MEKQLKTEVNQALAEFRFLLETLDFTETQIKILEEIAARKITAREIEKRTNIRRSHIHDYLKQLRLTGFIEETKFRPKSYGLSVNALSERLDQKKKELKEKLSSLEKYDVKSLISSLQAVEERIEAVTTSPQYLSNAEEFHDKASDILNVSKKVIISTNWPFPWTEKYQVHQKPHKQVEKYWKEHNRFLEKSKNKKFQLIYLVNIDKFTTLLNSKPLQRRIGSIEAIIDCLKKIQNGYNLDFLPTPIQGTKIVQTTFIVGIDSGLFAISMADSSELVLYGLFMEHKVLAEFYGRYVDILRDRYGELPKDRVKKILGTVVTRVKMPLKDKRRFEQELYKMD